MCFVPVYLDLVCKICFRDLLYLEIYVHFGVFNSAFWSFLGDFRRMWLLVRLGGFCCGQGAFASLLSSAAFSIVQRAYCIFFKILIIDMVGLNSKWIILLLCIQSRMISFKANG